MVELAYEGANFGILKAGAQFLFQLFGHVFLGGFQPHDAGADLGLFTGDQAEAYGEGAFLQALVGFAGELQEGGQLVFVFGFYF